MQHELDAQEKLWMTVVMLVRNLCVLSSCIWILCIVAVWVATCEMGNVDIGVKATVFLIMW
jgi:abortive infection bacteriophage resistance protein